MEKHQIDFDKITKEMHSANEYLDKKYGKTGTPIREDFSTKALSYYFGELIKESRKKKNLTQEQLAQKIGKERAYIARIEQGRTDMQISNFVQIIHALDISVQL